MTDTIAHVFRRHLERGTAATPDQLKDLMVHLNAREAYLKSVEAERDALQEQLTKAEEKLNPENRWPNELQWPDVAQIREMAKNVTMASGLAGLDRASKMLGALANYMEANATVADDVKALVKHSQMLEKDREALQARLAAYKQPVQVDPEKGPFLPQGVIDIFNRMLVKDMGEDAFALRTYIERTVVTQLEKQRALQSPREVSNLPLSQRFDLFIDRVDQENQPVAQYVTVQMLREVQTQMKAMEDLIGATNRPMQKLPDSVRGALRLLSHGDVAVQDAGNLLHQFIVEGERAYAWLCREQGISPCDYEGAKSEPAEPVSPFEKAGVPPEVTSGGPDDIPPPFQVQANKTIGGLQNGRIYKVVGYTPEGLYYIDGLPWDRAYFDPVVLGTGEEECTDCGGIYDAMHDHCSTCDAEAKDGDIVLCTAHNVDGLEQDKLYVVMGVANGQYVIDAKPWPASYFRLYASPSPAPFGMTPKAAPGDSVEFQGVIHTVKEVPLCTADGFIYILQHPDENLFKGHVALERDITLHGDPVEQTRKLASVSPIRPKGEAVEDHATCGPCEVCGSDEHGAVVEGDDDTRTPICLDTIDHLKQHGLTGVPHLDAGAHRLRRARELLTSALESDSLLHTKSMVNLALTLLT